MEQTEEPQKTEAPLHRPPLVGQPCDSSERSSKSAQSYWVHMQTAHGAKRVLTPATPMFPVTSLKSSFTSVQTALNSNGLPAISEISCFHLQIP